MYSLPFFGITGGGQTLPIPTLYEYLETLNPPTAVPTIYEYLETLTPDESVIPSIYEYLNFTSLAIAITDPNKAASANDVYYSFTVSRNTPRNVTTTVDYRIVNVLNTLASDFVGGVFPSGTLVFAPNATTEPINEAIVGGTAPGKIFAFELLNASDSDGNEMIVVGDRIECRYGEVPLMLNAALWLDASDANTITATNGLISQWRDKSGFNRHANQNTGASQPSVASSGISFAGAKFFNLDLSALTGAGSLFIVHNYTQSSMTIFAHGSDQGAAYSYIPQAGSSSTITSNLFGTPTYYKNDVLQSWTSRNTIHTALTNQVSIVAAVNCLMSNFRRIGGYGSSYNFLDNIYEIVLIPGVISTESRNLLTGYLASKWGLTASLPEGHPYKP